MATPTAAEIKARYPALSTIADPVIEVAIADAVPWFDADRWGAFYAQGFAAFVAHMVVADQRAAAGNAAGASGLMTSKKVGDVEVQYAAPAVSIADVAFASTSYGQRYLQLRRLIGIGGISV